MTPNAPKRAPRVCLTGGIASGKSRVSQWFAGRGWAVICTDEIVHELYRAGQPVAAAVGREFGAGVLARDGSVDRPRLGRLVFADPSKLRRLNELVHPSVRGAWRERADRASGEGRAVMVVIPLAYETEVAGEFDEVWVVACSAHAQGERLAARGLDRAATGKRVAAQLPLQSKVDRADRVVWNDGPWESTVVQLDRIEQERRRGLTLS